MAREDTYYQLDFSNHGGLVMPLILQFEFADGSREIKRIPAEIWSRNSLRIPVSNGVTARSCTQGWGRYPRPPALPMKSAGDYKDRR